MNRCKWCIHAKFTSIAHNNTLVHGPECELGAMGVKFDSFKETYPPSYFCGYYEMRPECQRDVINTAKRWW